MVDRALNQALVALRRAALRRIARQIGAAEDTWRLDLALRAGSFDAAIDALRAPLPWYMAGYGRVRYWVARAAEAADR